MECCFFIHKKRVMKHKITFTFVNIGINITILLTKQVFSYLIKT